MANQKDGNTIKNWVVLLGAIGIFYTTIKGTVDLFLVGAQKRSITQFAATDKIVDYVFEMTKSNTIQINNLTNRVTILSKDLADAREEGRTAKIENTNCQKQLSVCTSNYKSGK